MRRAAPVLACLAFGLSLSAQSAAEALYRVTLNLYPGDDPAIVAAQLAGTYRGRIETASTDEPGAIRIHLSSSGARLLTSDPRVAHVVEIAPNDTGSTWSTGTYAYDAAGNIKTIGSDTFVYDRIGRVGTGTAGPGHSQAYTYDPFGNILTVTTDGNTAAQLKLGVNPINNRIDQSQSPFNVFGTYSSSGNMTSHTGATYVYDAVDMVKESTVDGVRKLHLYNAEDERIASVTMQGTTPQTTDWTIRDAGGKVLRRLRKPSNGNWDWVEDYIYRGDSMLAAEVNTPERRRQFHPDHLGTPRLITGGGGAELSRHTYYPFGQEVQPAPFSTELKKFTGHERDSANLDYMHARSYKPYWGRFLSVDPTWESADLNKPQSWNRYSYVLNNPANMTDADGKCGVRCALPWFDLPQEWVKTSWKVAGVVAITMATWYSKGEAIVAPQADESADQPPRPSEAYDRQKHYGRTPTAKDRKDLGAGSDEVVNHEPALVKRFYEGDPATGEKPGHQMTPQERRESANDRTRMNLQPKQKSCKQGADCAQYSKEKKKEYELDPP